MMADIEKLYGEYYGFVYRYLLSLCHDENLATELTAETFFRAYINLASLKSEEKAPIWLCSIAKHLYYVHYNKSKKQLGLTDVAEIADPCDLSEKVVDGVLAKEALQQVYRLKQPYRDVLLLVAVGGRSLKEVSLSYGKSESWARVTYYRAKQKIVEKMEGK